jgi:formylglycine-generating enzyme required for sulfatase activity
MGVTEVPQDWITKATNLGMTNVVAGAFTGNQPATNMTWYESAAFVNWLNTSRGYQAAYNLTFSGSWSMTLWSSGDAWQAGGENLFRHKDAYYFLPSEDEWYKAAYHKNDGVTANYWDYATGSNSIPTAVASGTALGSAVYRGAASSPASVNDNGGLSAYGTRGQNGNVWEWQESAFDGLNNVSSETRAIRGGAWTFPEDFMRSSLRDGGGPTLSNLNIGFRVASVVPIPEPSSAMLMIGSCLMLITQRRRERSI